MSWRNYVAHLVRPQRWFTAVSEQRGEKTHSGNTGANPAYDGASSIDLTELSEQSLSKMEIFEETGLTPEQYILVMLHEHGGRMKQKEIVETTGWSDSSVSRLLAKMENESRISKVQIGRKNIVSLSGHLSDEKPSDDEEED